MYYLIYAEDIAESLSKRMTTRPAHIERLEQLKNSGRLLAAGPTPNIDSEDPGSAGFSGSVIIAEFDSLEDAKSWAEQDPYMTAGVYEKVTVKPFKYVLP